VAVNAAAQCPLRVIFDQSDQPGLAVHIRFALKADLKLGATGRGRAEEAERL